jgi:putative transposase
VSRAHSRKVKGSANRRKSAARLARLHARIANVRRDALHKATTQIVEQFDVIGIEDLNVRGMMANGKLSRAVADVGMFEFGGRSNTRPRCRGVVSSWRIGGIRPARRAAIVDTSTPA